MSLSIDVENVVATADCKREFDTDDLVMNHNALKDLNSHSAKYCFPIPSSGKERDLVINVYRTGNILCLGSNSVERATEFMKRIIEKLGASAKIIVKMVVMSGTMDVGYTVDPKETVRLLQRQFATVRVTEVMGGVIVVHGGNVHTQMFCGDVIRIVSSGPSEEAVTREVEKIHDSLKVVA